MTATLTEFPSTPTFGYTGEQATAQRQSRSLEGRIRTRVRLACPRPVKASVWPGGGVTGGWVHRGGWRRRSGREPTTPRCQGR